MHSMVDGVFDLLAAILVLGIVVGIAFSFIFPLTKTEYMQYDTQYEDKAMLGYTVDYSNPNTYESLTRRMYSYEELVLLMAVQNNKILEPKGVSLRNLVTAQGTYDLTNSYDSQDLNKLPLGSSGVLKAIQLYAENHIIIVPGGNIGYPASGAKNIGIVRMTDDYSTYVYEMCEELSQSTLGKASGSLLNTPKRYYITYQYALPTSQTSKLIYQEPIYVVQVKNTNLDTLQISQTYLTGVRRDAKGNLE